MARLIAYLDVYTRNPPSRDHCLGELYQSDRVFFFLSSLFSLLSQEYPIAPQDFEDRYRHYLGRHLSTFSAADDTLDAWPVNLAHGLSVLPAAMFGIRHPSDRRLPPWHDTVFVLLFNHGNEAERLYLVNTEGFAYCKYIVPCFLSSEDHIV